MSQEQSPSDLYIAYKFQGNDPEHLRAYLEQSDQVLRTHGLSTFIYWRDVQRWKTSSISSHQAYREIITGALAHLKNARALMAILDSAEKSEGMLLEIGFAHALNKPIYLLSREDIRLRFVPGLATEIVQYSDVSELPQAVERFSFLKQSR